MDSSNEQNHLKLRHMWLARQLPDIPDVLRHRYSHNLHQQLVEANAKRLSCSYHFISHIGVDIKGAYYCTSCKQMLVAGTTCSVKVIPRKRYIPTYRK